MKKLLITLAFIFGAPFHSQATETRDFLRCYAMIARTRAAHDHPLLTKIKNGEVTGNEACLEVLNSVNLDQNGFISNYNDEKNWVLRTINDVHRGWFPRNDFITDAQNTALDTQERIYEAAEPALILTRAFFQPLETPARIENIFQGEDSVMGLRQSSIHTYMEWIVNNVSGVANPIDINIAQKDRLYIFSEIQGYPSFKWSFPHAHNIMGLNPLGATGVRWVDWSVTPRPEYTIPFEELGYTLEDFPPLQTGRIKGVAIRTQTRLLTKAETEDRYPAGLSQGMDTGSFYSNTNPNLYLFKNMGGGIVGSAVNFMLNSGYNSMTKSDGGQVMFRRWSEMIQKSLLCKDLPSLRGLDAIKNMQTQKISEHHTPPYRTNIKCMQCHASIDPMAGVARNFSIRNSSARTENGDDSIGVAYIQNFMPSRPDPGFFVNPSPKELNIPKYGGGYVKDYILSHNPELEEVCALNEHINTCAPKLMEAYKELHHLFDDYHLSEPKGRLFLRGYRGDIIDVEVNNISELGEAIGLQHEVYACMVSRYLEHFTGYSFHMNDPMISGIPLTETEERLRAFIEIQAEELQSHQNPRKTIEAIFQSSFYQKWK